MATQVQSINHVNSVPCVCITLVVASDSRTELVDERLVRNSRDPLGALG